MAERESRRLETPDGRYFVSRGRLWRQSDPRLGASQRRAGIKKLMQARMADRRASDEEERAAAREAIEAAKRALGERGPVWWTDGAPDETGLHPGRSRYADWWRSLDPETREAAERGKR